MTIRTGAGIGNQLLVKTKAGAFVSADGPPGTAWIGIDTVGATVKLYTNNAGVLVAVALA